MPSRRQILGLSGLAISRSLFVPQPAQSADLEFEHLDLWPGTPPGAPDQLPVQQVIDRTMAGGPSDRAITHVANPRLDIFRPKKPNGSALLILPGGGYERVVMDKEGYETAQMAAAAGVTAFVLFYRLPGDGWANPLDVSLQDAQQAIRMIRFKAAEFGIDPKRVCVMGFSAGGHVGAKLAHRFSFPVGRSGEISVRPDLVCLMYPVISMQQPFAHIGSRQALMADRVDLTIEKSQSADKDVPADAPPTLIIHAGDDTSVPVENALLLYAALRAAHVPAEMHLFEEGGHGFGLRSIAGKPIAAWPSIFLTWAKRHGWF